MAPPRIGLVAGLGSALACGSIERISAELDPGDFAIVVRGDGEGREQLGVSVVAAHGLSIELGDGPSFVFALSPDEVVAADGRSSLDLLAFSSSAPPPTGCGRCLLPPFGPSIALSPGDTCRIPDFARFFEVTEAGQLVEPGPSVERSRLTDFVRIGLPGACPDPRLEPVAINEQGALELSAFHGLGWPAEELALMSDGSVGIFAKGYAAIHAASGRLLEKTGEEVPFEGEVRGVVAMGDELFTLSRVPEGVSGAIAHARVHAFSRDLAFRELSIDPSVSTIRQARFFRRAPSEVAEAMFGANTAAVVFGGVAFGNARDRLFVCKVTGALEDCVEIAPEVVFRGRISDFVFDGSTLLVAHDGDSGSIIARGALVERQWRFESFEQNAEIASLVVSGRFLFTCGDAAPASVLIKSASLDRGALSLTEVARAPTTEADCETGRWRGAPVLLFHGGAFEVDGATGQAALIDLAAELGLAPRELVHVDEHAKRVVAIDECGQVFAGTASAARSIHRAPPTPTCIEVVARVDDGLVGFGRRSRFTVDTQGSLTEYVPLPDLPDVRPTAVAADSLDGSFLVGVLAEPWLFRVNGDRTLVVEGFERLVTKIVEISSGTHLVVSGGEAFVISGTTSARLELSVTKPELCITNVAAESGFAWLSGACGLVRVTERDGRLFPEVAPFGERDAKERFDAIRVLARDHLVTVDRLGNAFELLPRAGGLELRQLVERGESIDFLVGEPSALIGGTRDTGRRRSEDVGSVVPLGSHRREDVAGFSDIIAGSSGGAYLVAYGRVLRVQTF
ncbi:MAG: hypothetical protein HYV07_04000 [Deltaproteobacteria bacterium]|nr:hypothetical protein [Deltaproteobacteria bacterium]